LATEALKVSNINTYYGDSHVLHDVTFALEEGRVLALLGRNGAGKTTCISSIIGFLPVRRGRIELFGTEISGLPPESISQLGIGLVPQGRRIFASLSVRENLIIARQREKSTDTPWTLKRIFELFPALGERQRQVAGSLSGGEQQMLAIARALVSNPRVLLLDEPSEGLAPLIVAEVGRTIRKLKGWGQSIILVEQNSNLALDVSDHVVILNIGRCVFDGSVEDVRNNPNMIIQHLGVFQNA
jgi:branched-chain amino acid transport system ATP-binding protein